MSKPRIVVRVLLMLLLVGMCWILYLAWSKSRPDYYLGRARAAISRGDVQAAMLYLQNVLRDFPDDARGHESLAQVLLAEAKAAGRPDTYVRNAEARRQLTQAADLRPQDLALQKELLKIYLDIGSPTEAVRFAQRVATGEPENGDALLASAWHAINSQDTVRAESLLKQLASHPTSDHPFQTAVLNVRWNTGEERNQQRQQLLAAAVEQILSQTPEALAKLRPQENLAMNQLLQTRVAEAADIQSAHQAADVALGIYDRILGTKDPDTAELALVAGQVMTLLSDAHPLPPQDTAALAARRELAQRADRLWTAAIEAGTANVRIYNWAATEAMARGEHESAQKILDKCLASLQAPQDPSRPATPSAGPPSDEQLTTHLLAARNLLILRRYDDIEEHLQPLLANKNFEGWARLLAGSVDSANGRHEKALGHYLQAERRLGQNLFVQVGLANAYLQLGQWSEALPRLEAILGRLDANDPEQQAWQALYQAFDEELHWNILRAYLAQGDWEKAKPHLKALSEDPRFGPQALAVAASYQWSRNERSQAMAIVTRARSMFPRDLQLLQLQAAFLWQQDQRQEAEQLIERLAVDARDDLASQLYLVRWRVAQGRVDEGLNLLDELISRFPKEPAPTLLKAQILLAQNKPSEAAALAEKLGRSPQSATLGGLLEVATDIKQQNLPEASKRLKQIDESLPSSSPWLSLWEGKIAAAQGDFSGAIAALGDSLDVTNLRQQAQLILLRSLQLLADQEGPTKADERLTPLLEQHPEDPFLRIVRAALQFKQGKFDDGLRSLDEAEQLQPDRPTGAYLKAAAWSQVGDLTRALAEIERALQVDPQDLASHILASQLTLAAGNYELAIQHAGSVLQKRPNYGQMYLIQAEALRQLKKAPEAVALLEGVIQQQPQFVAARRGLAFLHVVSENLEKALQVSRESRQALPKAFIFVIDEISILGRQNQLDAAQKVATESVGDPPDPAKCLVVAQTFSSVGQREVARQWAGKALELGDGELKPAAHRLLGDLAVNEGLRTSDRQKLAEARDHFAAVYEVQPTDAVAGNNLAFLLATEFNEPEKALEIVEQVRGKARVEQMSLGFIDTLAVVYRGAKQLDKAQQLLEQAVTRHPDEPNLLFHLGMVQANRDQSAAARGHLEKAIQLGGLSEEQKDQAQRRLATLH